MMNIEFTCGHVAENVGVVSMAVTHHKSWCTDAACQKDCDKTLAEDQGFTYFG